jgi:hypothetical protein
MSVRGKWPIVSDPATPDPARVPFHANDGAVSYGWLRRSRAPRVSRRGSGSRRTHPRWRRPRFPSIPSPSCSAPSWLAPSTSSIAVRNRGLAIHLGPPSHLVGCEDSSSNNRIFLGKSSSAVAGTIARADHLLLATSVHRLSGSSRCSVGTILASCLASPRWPMWRS